MLNFYSSIKCACYIIHQNPDVKNDVFLWLNVQKDAKETPVRLIRNHVRPLSDKWCCWKYIIKRLCFSCIFYFIFIIYFCFQRSVDTMSVDSVDSMDSAERVSEQIRSFCDVFSLPYSEKPLPGNYIYMYLIEEN